MILEPNDFFFLFFIFPELNKLICLNNVSRTISVYSSSLYSNTFQNSPNIVPWGSHLFG